MTKGKDNASPRSFLALSQMAHVIHMFKRYRQTHVTAFGVTIPQFNELERYGELNPSRIADLLFSDRPTTTVIIKNLERRGWVQRDRDEVNRKYVVIRITATGRDKLRELREAEEKQSGDFEPLACFTEKELSQLEALLDKLILHFRDLPKISGSKGGT
jgi:DNA-binding MarR family transcriptional regulator